MGSNVSTAASPQLMLSLEAGAAKAAAVDVDAAEHPADTQLQAAMIGIQEHFLRSFGLKTRPRVDAIKPPKASGTSFLVVADFRHAYPEAEGGGIAAPPMTVEESVTFGSGIAAAGSLSVDNRSNSPTSPTSKLTSPTAQALAAALSSKPTVTRRAAFKSSLTSAAMCIARCLEAHRGQVALQVVGTARGRGGGGGEPLTADEVIALLLPKLSAACVVASPELRAVDSPDLFRHSRDADPQSVLVLPPVEVGASETAVIKQLPHSLVATVAPHVDVLVFDAPGAIFEPHEAIGRLPAAVGRVCLGYSGSLEFSSLSSILAAPAGSGTRILIAGLIPPPMTAPPGAKTVPFVDHIGRSEARLDHLCCLFDVIVLLNHPPLSDPGSIQNFLAAAERRGVRVVRGLDCAMPNKTGAVVDCAIGGDDPWPTGPDVLGIGSRTVGMLRGLIQRETRRTGSVNLTVLGSWTQSSPCEGLRDVVLACDTQPAPQPATPSQDDTSPLVPVSLIGQSPPPSRVTIVSDSDFMIIRAHPKGAVLASSSANNKAAGDDAEAAAKGNAGGEQKVTLARLPPDFGAEFSRITIPAARVALVLCGVAPTQLVNFPDGPGLTAGAA